MQKRTLILIFTSLFLLHSCGKTGKGNSNALADKNALINIDAFAAKSGHEEIVCDGEGTELSGVYSFKFTDSTLICPNMKDTQMNPSESIYTCTQKGKDFSCINQKVAKDIFSGCINKDGKFKMTFTNDPAAATTPSDTKVFLVGTLGKSDGRIQYTMPKQGAQGPVTCISTGKVEVTEISQ